MSENIQIISPSHFEKIKKLGSGGVGRVYLAKEKTSNLEYAIKFIKLDKNDEIIIEKHIKSVHAINHPCILPIIGYSPPDPAKKRPFSLVTKYQKNGSLLNLIKSPETFTNLIKMKIIYGVVEGLRYLHEFKIKHQHLFLTNVLLDDDFNPYLTDISQDCYSSDNLKLPPESKAFIAPEILPNNPATFSSDVFSFGMLLFTILTNQLPFKLDDESIQNGTKPDINMITDESFRNIVTKCLCEDPNERPSFEEILLMLIRDEISLELNEDEAIELTNFKIRVISPSFSLAAISSTSKKITDLENQNKELQKNFDDLQHKFEELNAMVNNFTKSVKIVSTPDSNEHPSVMRNHHPPINPNLQNSLCFPSLVPSSKQHDETQKVHQDSEIKQDEHSVDPATDDLKETHLQPSPLEPVPQQIQQPSEPIVNNIEPSPKGNKSVVIINDNNSKTPPPQNLLLFPRTDSPRLPMVPMTSTPNFMPQAGRRLSTKPPIKPVFPGQPQSGIDSFPMPTKPKFTDQSRKNRRNSMQPPIPQNKNRVEELEEESKLVQGIQPPMTMNNQHQYQKINQNLTVSPTPPQYYVENGINYNQAFAQMDPIKSKDVTGAIQCQFEYKPFEGIVYYLTNECQGQNIVDKGLLTITGNSADKTREADLKNLVDFKWTYCWTSENKPDSWIKFDFGRKQMFLTHYTLKTYPSGRNFSHLKNWVIEGSSNGDTWIEIDKRTDNNDLNGRSKVQTFICSNPSDAQILRLRQIGPNHYGDDYLILTNIEFFGYLL